MLLWVVLPTSVIALGLGCRAHRDRIGYGIFGLSMIVLAAVLGHDLLAETGERVVTISGSAFLIAGHFRNQRLCRQDQCHEHDAITEPRRC